MRHRETPLEELIEELITKLDEGNLLVSAITDLTTAVSALATEVSAVVTALQATPADDPAVVQAVTDINNATSQLQAAVAALPHP